MSNPEDGTQPEGGMSEEDILARLTPREEEEPKEDVQDQAAPEAEDQDAQQQSEDASDPFEEVPDELKWLTNKHKVTVQGQEIEISADEAFKGYMRQQDYTRKTQEAAEQSRKAEQLFQHVQQEYGNRINQLDALGSSLYRELVGDQQKLASLIETDPQEYLRQQAAMQSKVAMLNQVTQAQKEYQAMQANQAEKHRQELYAQNEQKLLESLPTWRDAEKRQTEQREIAQFLMDTGYSPDDLNELYDHRAVLIAREAMMWRKSQAVRQKQVSTQATPPKVVKPGASNPTNVKQNQSQQAFAKFRKTGRDDDAVAYLLARSQ